MKKILFIIIVLFVFIIKPSALTKFSLGERIPNFYTEVHKGNLSYSMYMHVMLNSDGKVTYCLNPYSLLKTDVFYNEYEGSLLDLNLNDDIVNKINLVSYFGYGYKNHTDIKWYGITQYLIWKVIGQDSIYFTDSKYGNRVDIYDNDVLELENLINEYNILPSFYNNTYDFTINENYEILDENGVLNNFEISESNIDAKIIDNRLIINTNKTGNYKINFIKKSEISKSYIIYDYPNAQPVILPGKYKDLTFSINIKVESGNITINKIDSENKNRVEATLQGAKYGIYKDNDLVYTLETNDEGIACMNNIPLGKYIIKEIVPSKGYNLDKKIYDIDITKENNDIVINSYEDVITGNLIINKFYDDKKEDGAVFEIYNNNLLLGEYKTINGLINIDLEFGNYYIKQVRGIDGYNFVEDFYVNINENNIYEYNLIDTKKYNKINDELVVEVPNTGKKDYKLYKLYIYVGLILIFVDFRQRKKTIL